MESHKPGEFTLGEVAEVIKRTAYKVTRVGEIIGKEVAQRLDLPFGVADLSLAPTPAVGDSVGEIFQSVGLSSIGAPGTTAVLAMLNDAVKKGRRVRLVPCGRFVRRVHPGFRGLQH